ncbi:MAG: DUF2341 domain-containing protein [Thermodesulfobacteriota bacterium]
MKNATHIIIGLLATLWLLLCASPALAWWNDQWQYRKKIGFDSSPAGTDIKEALIDAPVLIRLHAGNFNFNNAKPDGSDIRFVQSDDKTPLKHHIEKYDPLDGIGLLWVKVPTIAGGSNQGFAWMYHGNASAVGGQDPGGTYDPGFAAVYHLAEVQGSPKDSTSYGNHVSAFTGGQGLPSVIGNGISLSGGADGITISKSPSLAFANGFTFSAWVKIAQPQQDVYLFSMEDEKGRFLIRITGTRVCSGIRTAGKQAVITEDCVDLPLNTWEHLTVTVQPKGRLTIYHNGIEITWKEMNSAPFPQGGGNITIGGSAEGRNGFVGDLDEIRISSLARPVGWVRAAYLGEGPDAKLCAIGQEEVNAGGDLSLAITYLKVIAKNINLDGWVINGILTLFWLIVVLIFVVKAFIIRTATRENDAFLGPYRCSEDLLGLQGQEEDFANSIFFRIYKAGCEEVKARQGNPNPSSGTSALSPTAMNAIKTVLEASYMKEVQRLNSWMVWFTLAIAGGPFLGLLGTVWGVMNTFAAMAVAGEANIAAIAPGMASALSTTVMGLIVAIPALFGYNYLVGGVKDLTADVGVFVDQFAARIEEHFGGRV